jgi:hypothetical protein
MTATHSPEGQAHTHTAVTTLVLKQRDGIPYEFERVVCDSCKQLLAERKVRRAAG